MSREYNVVVVEDEWLILHNIIKKIENSDQNFRVIGSAENGRDALTIIDDLKPDVLFTDIKMPIMEGIDLIKAVREKYPNLYIVIISGYRDFEYAKNAMKYSVTDYMLKPLEVGELVNLLKNIRKKLDSVYLEMERDIICKDISGKNSSYSLPSSLSKSSFLLFLICIGNLQSTPHSSQSSSSYNEWENMWLDSVLNTPSLKIRSWWLVDEHVPNQKFLIVSLDDTGYANITDIAQNLKAHLLEHIPNSTVNICFYHEKIEYCDIWNVSQELRGLMEQNLVIGISQLHSYKDAPIKACPIAYIDEKIKNRLQIFIQNLDLENLKIELVSLLRGWVLNKIPQRQFEKGIQKIIDIFQSQLNSISEIDLNRLYVSIIEKISFCKNQDEIFESVWSMIELKLLSYKNSGDNTKMIADSIEAYLRNNFTQDIKIEEISKLFNFNSSYLTKIFKRYKGETPVRVLINLRIEEARRLIESRPDMDLKDVGQALGYSDSSYFSRVFKNITGKSPSEYRENTKHEA